MTDYSNTPVSVDNLKAYLELKNGLHDYRPGEVSNLTLTTSSGKVVISWTDTNVYAQDSSITATWKKAVVIRKEGSEPENIDDGVEIVSSETKNAYSNSGYADTTVINGKTYYYKVFSYNNYYAHSYGVSQMIVAGYDDNYKPGSISNVVAKKGNGKVTISWTDTDTAAQNGASGISWSKVELRYSTNSAPSISNGTLALTETVKNTYSTDGYEITGLTNNTTYYFSLFTYNNVGLHDDGVSVNATPKATQVMTVRIDTTNSNPDTCCVYTDDASNMTAKSDEWDEFFGHYPVLLAANGTEVGKLNPNDFSKFTDGSSADITSGSAGDVMICFPRRDIRIYKNGNYLYVSMTDDLDATNYTHYAHKKGSNDVDQFYYGAYVASNVSTTGRSLSGKSPYVSVTLTTARTNTIKRSNWYLAGYYQRLYLQIMFILKYKSLNGQTALGRGWVDGSAAATTGLTNALGMDYGNTSSGTNTTTNRMKIFGVEDFWGNVWQWCDGCYSNSSTHLTTSYNPANFNDTGSNYTDVGTIGGSGSYINTVLGTSEGGFAPTASSGSQTTYYSDYGYSFASCCVSVGGRWSNAGTAGPFYFSASNAASLSNTYIGFRTMYIA